MSAPATKRVEQSAVLHPTSDTIFPVRAAAAGAATIYLGFAGMQVALAAGAPLGEHVWGGTQDRVLSGEMRIVSCGAAAALTAMAGIIARRGCLLGHQARWLAPATWGIAGYMALNTLGNLASASPVERYGFAAATAVASGLSGFVAYHTRGQ